jgi:hypothetical protein
MWESFISCSSHPYFFFAEKEEEEERQAKLAKELKQKPPRKIKQKNIASKGWNRQKSMYVSDCY